MPRSGSEKPAIVTKNKRSSESPEPTEHRHPRPKQSSSGSQKSPPKKDQESGQGRRGSPASKRDQANLSAPSRRFKVAEDCTNLLNVPLPVSGGKQAADLKDPDVKPTNSSAAYLTYRIDKEVERRKRAIVDNLMSAITKCVEQRLEALEEECDQSSGSQPSSRAVQVGKPISRSAGQKRSKGQGNRDESENEEEDEGSSRRKRDNKRTKTTKDDTRPRFACPYHQYDRARFGTERTCCGPGWPDISRVKEHLERKHSLPAHKCNRCLRRFDKAEVLMKHQQAETACPRKDPGSFKRNLSDGYDEEQAKKLKGRPRMGSVEKWREWYSILFNLRPDSPEIPSPYYDLSLPGAKVPCTQLDDVEHWRELWVRAKPALRNEVAKTVAEVFDDYEPDLKTNVLERLQDLPRRIAESFPFPGLNSEETSTAVDNIGLFNCLDMLEPEMYGGESFDFHEIDNGIIFPNQLPLDFTESDSSDTYKAGDSSATSVGDDTAYQQLDSKSMVIPQNIDFNLSNTRFY